MCKKLFLLISFVFALSGASISYGSDPCMIKLDINIQTDNNEPNTQVGFTGFTLEDSGTEVNGVTIDFTGDLQAVRRDEPKGIWWPPDDPCAVYYPRAGERIYRDFIYSPWPDGVTITLWGLGVNRDCNVTIWAYDYEAEDWRIAKWYGNGTHIFDTSFIGGGIYIPGYEDIRPEDLYLYAFSGRATTDELGRIVLTSEKDPASQEGQPFAFVNAIVVEPNSWTQYVQPDYAHRPVPFDGSEDISLETILTWRKGARSEKRDVYLGTNFDDVSDANRSNPLGVLVSENQDANTYDHGGASGFLGIDKQYYWRVDEVNTTPGPNSFWKGEVWSFKTLPYSIVDDFDSYLSNDAIRAVWQEPVSTRAVIYSATDEYGKVRSGRSMEYWYANYSSPYYSEVNATVGDLGIDPNWTGIGAKSLSVWFYGQEDNDANEQMYIKLVDSDTPVHIAKVNYPAMSDIKEEEWQEWNIELTDFTNVNLSKIAKICIGFGDKIDPGDDPNGLGTVYFDDFRLYLTRCILSERDADFARVDYAPLDAGGYPGGDCTVDYKELEIMAEYWLNVWDPWWPPPPNPVAYWPMDEGAGNKIFTDPCDPLYEGTFSETGVSWVTPGVNNSNAALHFDGGYGTRVSCGNQNPASEANELTLAAWVRWLGPRIWDDYLKTKSQGLISKRGGWSDSDMMFEFEVDTAGMTRSFALRHYETYPPDVYAPNGILTPYIGQWAHLAATFDGTTSETACKLYLNGEEVASGSFRFSAGTDAYLTIGNTMDVNAWPNSPEGFYGDVDEVLIYSRALTANEIRYLAGREPPFDLYRECWWECPIVINFKDYAVLANYWLKEDVFP